MYMKLKYFILPLLVLTACTSKSKYTDVAYEEITPRDWENPEIFGINKEEPSKSEKSSEKSEAHMGTVNNQRIWDAQLLVRRLLRSKEVSIFGSETCENCNKLLENLKNKFKFAKTSFA